MISAERIVDKLLGKYLLMLIHSLNPNMYDKLTQHSVRELLWFFAKTLLLGMVLFLVTFIPIAFVFINQLPERLDEVERFEMQGTVQAGRPIMLASYPGIVLHANATREQALEEEAEIVLTDQGVVYPEYLFFGAEYVPWSELSDLKQATPERDRLLAGIIVFLLPSIIFWYFLVRVLQVALVMLFLVLFGYWAPRVFRHRIRLKELAKVVVLAMSPMILISMGLAPLAPRPLFWWGFFLTLGIFILVLAMLSERVTGKV